MGAITRGIANNILGSGAVDGTDGLSGTVPANNVANGSLNNITAFPASVSAGIPSVTSNPSPVSEGDVWYNSAAYKLRVQGRSTPAGSWASGGSLNTAKYQLGSVGTQTAGLAFGGSTPPFTATNESYNGSSWTEVADLNTGRDALGSAGTQTAAIGFGGQNGSDATRTTTETWNGSAWTEVNDLNSGRRFIQGTGNVNTAALCIGGYDGSNRAYVENWNGSSWTEIADLNTARAYVSGIGTPTAAIAISGASGTTVELWDGSAWTEVAEYNTSRGQGGSSGFVSTDALFFGGEGPNKANTEIWNGTSWTEIADLALARSGHNGAGGTGLAIAIGGQVSPKSGTEEFTAPTGSLDVTLTT